ncbi:hypothetical protein R3P38DRAFT_2801194 [Favolaschia claudopus]|uniref:Uncharacterized protein n=1 Tax=Favolaschia claudopus TaxID=2862362 RepID=A0AAV9ZX71_9AGAR
MLAHIQSQTNLLSPYHRHHTLPSPLKFFPSSIPHCLSSSPPRKRAVKALSIQNAVPRAALEVGPFFHRVLAAGRLTPPLQTSSSVDHHNPESILLPSSSRGAAKRRYNFEYTDRRPPSNAYDSAAGRLTPPLQTSSSEHNTTPATLFSSSSSRGAAKRRYDVDYTDRRPPSNQLSLLRGAAARRHSLEYMDRRPASDVVLGILHPTFGNSIFGLPASGLPEQHFNPIFFLRCAAIYFKVKPHFEKLMFGRPASGMFAESSVDSERVLADHQRQDLISEIRFLVFRRASSMATVMQDIFPPSLNFRLQYSPNLQIFPAKSSKALLLLSSTACSALNPREDQQNCKDFKLSVKTVTSKLEDLQIIPTATSNLQISLTYS